MFIWAARRTREWQMGTKRKLNRSVQGDRKPVDESPGHPCSIRFNSDECMFDRRVRLKVLEGFAFQVRIQSSRAFWGTD